MIKVSIIVPIYNVENYIDKCINSLLSQTLKDIEIILIDDGSTDKCGEIIEKYAKIDKRIKTFHKLNGGLASARNKGLDLATGQYVAFCDPDDWVDLTMYEVLYENAVLGNYDLVVCGYKKVFMDGIVKSGKGILPEIIDVTKYNRTKYFIDYILSYKYTDMTVNKLYKREIIENNNLRFINNNEVAGEDTLYNMCFSIHVNKIKAISNEFYNYYQRPGSIINSPKRELISKYFNLVLHLEKYAKEKCCEEIVTQVTPIALVILEISAFQKTLSSLGSKKVFNEFNMIGAIPEFRRNLRKGAFDKNTKKLTGLGITAGFLMQIILLFVSFRFNYALYLWFVFVKLHKIKSLTYRKVKGAHL